MIQMQQISRVRIRVFTIILRRMGFIGKAPTLSNGQFSKELAPDLSVWAFNHVFSFRSSQLAPLHWLRKRVLRFSKVRLLPVG